MVIKKYFIQIGTTQQLNFIKLKKAAVPPTAAFCRSFPWLVTRVFIFYFTSFLQTRYVDFVLDLRLCDWMQSDPSRRNQRLSSGKLRFRC